MYNIKDPNRMLEIVTSVLVIDLLDQVKLLGGKIPLEALIDPPKGIYLKGSLKPFITDNVDYYAESVLTKKGLNREELVYNGVIVKGSKVVDFQEERITDFQDILGLTENLIDECGTVVLTADDIKRRSKYMSLTPSIPVIAIEVAALMVKSYLDSICPYNKTVRSIRSISENTLEEFVKESYHHLIDEDEFDVEFESLLNIVSEFVGDDLWFIYTHRIKGTDLIIEKLIDFRIYDWYRMKYDQQQLENKEIEELSSLGYN